MARRINIAVSDGLFERLEKVKGNFNVSRVCQVALEREVSYQELLSVKGKTMEQTIERLKAEKGEAGQEYFDDGKRAGIKDGPSIHYNDLREAKAYNDAYSEVDETTVPRVFYDSDLWNNYDLEMAINEAQSEDANLNEDWFILGWIEGVAEFFESIEDQL
jgi:predicted CopG family antitoxin